MYYSELFIRDRQKVSVSLYVIAVISVFGFFAFFLKTTSTVPLKASSKLLLRNSVVNVSPIQAAIFWQTGKSEVGWVIYGKNKNSLSNIAIDERDVANNKIPHIFHYAVLNNLEENTTYYYKLVSSAGIYSDQSNNPFTLLTPKNTLVHSSLKPVYGTVLQQNSQPSEGSFVILTVDQMKPLLAVTKTKGEFMVPLAYFVEPKSNSLLIPGEDRVASIEILGESGKSSVRARLNQLAPLSQTIVLGKDYDLTEASSVLSASTHTVTVTPSDQKTDLNDFFGIIFPKDNAIVPSQRPLIKGTALPSKEVIVSINSSPEYNFRTVADKDGAWMVQPTTPILPGKYSVTVSTNDKNGNKMKAVREFVVAKSGEQVLGEATTTASLSPTQEPTAVPSPTSVSTAQTITAQPPQTGMNDTIPFITSSSLIILGIGMLLVF